MAGPLTGAIKRLAIKKCGVGAAGVWGTAVACGALDEMLFLTGQIKRSAPVEVSQSRGRAYSVDGTPGPISATSTLTFELRYASFELLAAMFMGTAGVPAQQGGSTAYLHTLDWNTDPYGLMVTVAIWMASYIEECPTAKVTGITISGEVGAKPLTLAVEMIGINREVASAVNTLVTAANWTLPTDADKYAVMFSQLVFRMNSQSGIALAVGDRIYPAKFTLSLKRAMKGEYNGTYRTSGSSPQDLVDEVSNDGFPDTKLTLEFATHTGATYLTALAADSRYKMDITATGPLIAATYYYTHLWQFPHLQMLNDDPTDDNGRIKEPLEFQIHGAVTAPTGMTGITGPMRWSQTTKRSTNPLA